MRFWLLIVSLIVPGLFSGCQESSEFPSRPITLVCPWSPGGGTDQVSRQMAFFLEHELGVPCTVINATGGQGVTGHNRGLTSRPDGYTIAVITFELNTLHWQGLTDLTYEDAVPLLSVNEDAAAILVPADSPWQSLKDLHKEVVDDSGSLTASGTATGGAWHLALAGWLQSSELPPDAITWVPMGGADPSVQELLSGGIDLVCCSLPEAKIHLESGKIRALGVMAEDRVPGFEEIPTLREQGFDWTLVGWRGFSVPSGTPPERVETLSAAMKKIVSGEVEVEGKTFPGFMKQRGFNNRSRDAEDFIAFLKRSDDSLGKLLTSDAFRKLSVGKVGPYAFPQLLVALLGLLVVAQVIVSRKEAAPSATGEAAVKGGDHRESIISLLLAILCVVFYLVASETIGFLLSSAIILLVLLVRLRTSLLHACLITVILVPGIYQLFSGVLRVPLPRGWWGW